MDLKLTGKLALVTGSSAGIGYAICEALVREGIENAVRDQTVYTSAYNQTLQILNSEEFQSVVVENLDEELPALEPDQAVSEAVVNFFSGTKVFAALPNGMTAKLPSIS